MVSKTRCTQLFATGAGELDATGDFEGGATVGAGGREAARGATEHAANTTTASTDSFFEIILSKDTLVARSVPG
jgi:hypothetical protein